MKSMGRLSRWRVLPALLEASLLLTACRARSQSDFTQEPTLAPSASAPADRATLSLGQIARIEVIQKTLAEFDSDPLEQWIKDMQEERSPEKEILIYESVATTYRDYCARHTLTRPARREVYQLILMRSAMTEEEVLLKARPALLSTDEVREVLRSYPSTMPPSPAHT